LGFIWEPDRRFRAELYFAEGLNDVPEGGDNKLQDESIYFRLVGRLF
jgi:hypothetical protein